jgi:integrase
MGSVNRTASGKWRASWTDTEGHRHYSPSFPTKIAASDYLTNRRADQLNDVWIEPAKARARFGDVAAEFVEYRAARVRPSTVASDEAYLAAGALRHFARVPLGDIDVAVLDVWVADMIAAGKSPTTVHKYTLAARQVFDFAIRRGMIRHNPVEKLELPALVDHEAHYLDPDELDRLADAIVEHYRAAIYVGGYCGLRVGELFALDWTDIDLRHRELHVRRNAVEVKGRVIINAPKTKAGVRTVPIPAKVSSELAAHRLRLGAVGGGLVFPGQRGAVTGSNRFRARFFAPAAAAAGLAPLTPHDLRHTAISLWIAAGLDQKQVAVRAGHRSVVTVYDRYGHLYKVRSDEADAALDELAEGRRKVR